MEQKDYADKITDKLKMLTSVDDTEVAAQDINNFVNFMNYSFYKRNNFFINNFNLNALKKIYPAYNKLKTNIFDLSCTYIFKNITVPQLKSIKFIVFNAINNYPNINNEICSIISKDSLIRCSQYIKEAIELKITNQ